MGLLDFIGGSRRERQSALVASVSPERRQRAAGSTRSARDWQGRALFYYDNVGEIHYAATWYGNGMSKVRFYIEERDDAGEAEESEDAEIAGFIDRIRDFAGERDTILKPYGQLMFLNGECFLFVSLNEWDEEEWCVLSVMELKRVDGGYERSLPDGNTKVYREAKAGDDGSFSLGKDEAIAYRIWNRHPRSTYVADSPLLGVMNVCEEVYTLTQTISARSRSRLAGAGILAIPNTLGFVRPSGEPDDDPDQVDFVTELTEAMMTPIEDPLHAGSVVPLVVEGDPESIDKIKHITFHDPGDKWPEEGLRVQSVERLAAGLDLPIEVLLGTGDANHWTAWKIDEDAWKAHLQPFVEAFCRNLTAGYLWPSMISAGKTREEARRYRIGYDAAELIVAPDRTDDTLQLWDRYAISNERLVEEFGFCEDDMPDDEEIKRRIEIAKGTFGQPAPDPNMLPPGADPNAQQEPDQQQSEQDAEDAQTSTAIVPVQASALTDFAAQEFMAVAMERFAGTMAAGLLQALAPRIDVHVPEQSVPQVNITTPAPQVTFQQDAPIVPVKVDVHVPEQQTPQVKVDVTMPEQGAPVVHVNVPEQQQPKVFVPKQSAPKVEVHTPPARKVTSLKIRRKNGEVAEVVPIYEEEDSA